MRLKYGIFERKRGTRKWIRVFPDISGSKQSIISTFQSWLIAGAFDSRIERQVRPVKAIIIRPKFDITVREKD